METYVEKQVHVHPDPDGRWDVQIYPAGQVVDGKVYVVRIPIPAEVVGESITASIEPKVIRKGSPL